MLIVLRMGDEDLGDIVAENEKAPADLMFGGRRRLAVW